MFIDKYTSVNKTAMYMKKVIDEKFPDRSEELNDYLWKLMGERWPKKSARK